MPEIENTIVYSATEKKIYCQKYYFVNKSNCDLKL